MYPIQFRDEIGARARPSAVVFFNFTIIGSRCFQFDIYIVFSRQVCALLRAKIYTKICSKSHRTRRSFDRTCVTFACLRPFAAVCVALLLHLSCSSFELYLEINLASRLNERPSVKCTLNN